MPKEEGLLSKTIPLKNSILPFKLLLQSYTGPFSPTRAFLKSFQQKVPIFIKKGKYIIKTVENYFEFHEVLKLRYEIFGKEYQNKKFPFGLDKDAYDQLADHLIIFDNEKEKIVGTYRLITSTFSRAFYTQTEFEISEFLQGPGIKLELSRACIQKKYRTGQVMHLLWRGVAEYLVKTNSQYLFGLSSIKSMDPSQMGPVINHFRAKGVLLENLAIHPHANFLVPIPDSNKPLDKSIEIPPLLQMYLKMGAKVAPLPALDRDFHCFDFFTVLPLEKLKADFEKRYLQPNDIH